MDQSISDLVDEAVRLGLAEDTEDQGAFDDRVNEASMPYETVVKNLKRCGKI